MVDLRKVTVVLLLLILLFVNSSDLEGELDLVEKFLTSFQRVSNSVVFLCDLKNGKKGILFYFLIDNLSYLWLLPAYSYALLISSLGIFVNIKTPTWEMDITKVLPRTSYPKCGLIIDTKCPESEIVLGEVSSWRVCLLEE